MSQEEGNLSNITPDNSPDQQITKKGGKNARDLFAMRATYLAFVECGFKKPSIPIVAVAVAVLIGKDGDIDQTSIRKQVLGFKGPLSFEMYDRGDQKNAFAPIGEDFENGK